ncbi:FCD domain-containing protein [uncultured Marivita sp.]|uniref:FCD domain-containing protein n=1 Tax=uncultured Marivita sp. TaxID=888080 RepID=UPI003430D62A
MSGNPMRIGFLNYLSSVRLRVVWLREWERTYRRIETLAFQTLHSDQHERIVDVIEQRDAEGAPVFMTEHLEPIKANMSENL